MSDRFDASVKRGHQVTLSNVMGRLQAGSVFTLTPQELADLSALAGALNYWAAQVPSCATNLHDEIPRGDYSRKTWQASVGVVDVFPFVMPATGPTYCSAAEYDGQPWMRRLTVSTVPGDMDASHASDGKQATIFLDAGLDFPAGTRLYANLLLLEDAPPGTAGTGFSIVWP